MIECVTVKDLLTDSTYRLRAFTFVQEDASSDGTGLAELLARRTIVSLIASCVWREVLALSTSAHTYIYTIKCMCRERRPLTAAQELQQAQMRLADAHYAQADLKQLSMLSQQDVLTALDKANRTLVRSLA